MQIEGFNTIVDVFSLCWYAKHYCVLQVPGNAITLILFFELFWNLFRTTYEQNQAYFDLARWWLGLPDLKDGIGRIFLYWSLEAVQFIYVTWSSFRENLTGRALMKFPTTKKQIPIPLFDQGYTHFPPTTVKLLIMEILK